MHTGSSRLENMQVSVDASLQTDWNNNRLIYITIGQTEGEVKLKCTWELAGYSHPKPNQGFLDKT